MGRTILHPLALACISNVQAVTFRLSGSYSPFLTLSRGGAYVGTGVGSGVGLGTGPSSSLQAANTKGTANIITKSFKKSLVFIMFVI